MAFGGWTVGRSCVCEFQDNNISMTDFSNDASRLPSLVRITPHMDADALTCVYVRGRASTCVDMH